MANEEFSIIVRKAIKNDSFTRTPSECEKFVHQCLNAYAGHKYEDYMEASAKETAQAFRDAGIGEVPDHTDNYPQVGDILYKEYGSGGFGHVGVYVGRLGDATEGLVAENSSVHQGINGAKGFRPLSEFGRVSWVVRVSN